MTDGVMPGRLEHDLRLLIRDHLQPAMAHTPQHDKLLIVDFGSQVTQLIARRVREEGVYSEIVPFQKAEEAFRGDEAEGRDPLRRTGLRARAGRAARAARDLRGRRAGARHLLRRAGDGAAARRQGRGRASSRIRPRRGDGDRRHAAVRGRVGEGPELSGVDEPRRPRHRAARWLPHGRDLAECADRGDRRRRRGNSTPPNSISK